MASKRKVRQKECGDKKPYADIEQARKALGGLMGSNAYDGKPLNIYKCKWGKHYHIGHRKRHFERE